MKHHRHFSPRQRPPWWPENEDWPPKRWRQMRGNPFFRRMGCLFVVFNLVGLIVVGVIVGLFISAFDRGGDSTNLSGWILPIGGIFLAFVIGMSILAARNIRRMSSPLDELVNASNKVAEGDLSARVDVKGPPEVRTLLHGFNSMAERLQVNDQQRRNMFADVSHELRTPLSIIQGNIEGIMDGMYPADDTRLRSILEETQVLSRLIEDLRTLALAEGGALHLKREPTDLNELLRDTAAGFETQAKEKGISIELDTAQMEEVNIDPQRIREVLSNLVGNALRYAPNQSVVKIGLAESGSGAVFSGSNGPEKEALLFVEDNGPGIDSADVPHIFERFYKSSDSGGMGLGLSIAKYLVEAHGGIIWAENASIPLGVAGRGTKISFTLPVRAG